MQKLKKLNVDKEKLRERGAEALDAAKKAAINAKQGLKDGGDEIMDKLEQAKEAMDKYFLQPVFPETIQSDEYVYPLMVRIVEYDKHKKDFGMSGESIGYDSKIKSMRILNVFLNDVDQFCLTFLPEVSEGIYYMDPCHKNQYINLNSYFNYLKKARVDELEMIAHTLGAKHVKITLKEQEKVLVANQRKAKSGIKKKGTAQVAMQAANKKFVNFEVAAESRFEGGEPRRPVLCYFATESDIRNLINMRMDSEHRILEKKYNINYNKSSGIKESTAVDIDAVLGKLGVKGTASVSSEVERENRTELEYFIEF